MCVSPLVGTVYLRPLPPNFPDHGEYYVFTWVVQTCRSSACLGPSHAQEAPTSRQKPSGASTIPPGDASNDREAQELRKLVGLEAGATASQSQSAGLKASTSSESPAEEKSPEISKSPEQSENVIENKGLAAEEVRGRGVRWDRTGGSDLS
jgi:hypothetical protein